MALSQVEMEVGLGIHHCGVVTILVCRLNRYRDRWALASPIVGLSQVEMDVGLCIHHFGVVTVFVCAVYIFRGGWALAATIVALSQFLFAD